MKVIIPGTIDQGAIVEGVKWERLSEGIECPLSIVLSNACDIEHDKCAYLMVLGLLDAKDVLTSTIEYQKIKESNTKNIVKSAKNYLEKYIHNKEISRYFFIDPSQIIECDPLVVDFQLIMSIPFSHINEINPVAQLDSPLKELFITRYSAYTCRIPSPRLNEERCQTIIGDIVKE